MSWVFDHSKAEKCDRLVLLAIANHCDRYGRDSWPKIETVAVEARCSVREALYAIKALLAAGELAKQAGAGKIGRHAYSLPKMIAAEGDKLARDLATAKELEGANSAHANSAHAKSVNLGATVAPPTCNFRHRYKEEPSLRPNRPGEDPTETPTDLHALQYAARLLEEIGFPDDYSNKTTIANAISAEVKKGRSKAAAYELVLAGTRDGQDEGFEINKFFYADAKYLPANRRNSNGQRRTSASQERAVRTKENIIAGVRNELSRRVASGGSER